MAASHGGATKRQKLSAAMARYSVQSIDSMQRLLQAREGSKQPSGAAKRAFAKALQPSRNCYKLLSARAEENCPADIQFAVADMKSLLRYMAEASPCFLEMLQNAAMPLKFIVGQDECAAGNVLSTEARLKAMMFYGTFTACADIIDSIHAWIPIGVISHWQLGRIKGGMGAAHRIFIEDFVSQALDHSFEVAPGCHVQVQLAIMIADMDGQRMALCSKGSAALKPCSFCLDCVSRDATAAKHDPKFKTIEEADINVFTPHDHHQIQAYMAKNIAELATLTKATRELRERCVGYHITEHGMWNSAVCCKSLPLHAFQNDSMHCYYANGIVSSEITLLLEEVQRVTKKGPEEILQACLRAGWQRSGPAKRNGENASWLKKLFTPAFFLGNLYKGSAKQTRALAVLLRWLCATVWIKNPELSTAANSFLKLGKCNECLRRIAQLKHFDHLEKCQREHHQCFQAAFPGCLRPKHHHRLHLPAAGASKQSTKTTNRYSVALCNTSFKRETAEVISACS